LVNYYDTLTVANGANSFSVGDCSIAITVWTLEGDKALFFGVIINHRH